MSSTHTPNRLVYAQKQEYTLKLIGQKKVKTSLELLEVVILMCLQIIDSVVVVDLDDEDKIIRLVDQWNGKPPSAGFPIYWLRRANAKIVPWLVRVPK
jgi:hypothetical protein